MQYAVLFKRKDKLISEKCHVYEEQKYHLVCEPNDWQRAHTYELHIKSVSWADRGDWLCIYAANMTRQSLEVYEYDKAIRRRKLPESCDTFP
ncbi:unnamed protein product [Trichobilharzia regenti]|nr:unnamed protein product [Trichobilharzia regenti]